VFFKRLAYWCEDVSIRIADRVVVVSEVLADELKQKGIEEQKIIVNPNGVDPEKFNPNIDGYEIRKKYNIHDKVVVGFVGSFGPWHGVDLLAKTITRLIGTNSNLHFLFVGDGVMRPVIEKIIGEGKMEDFVTMTGVVSYDKIPQYLAASDIVVSPTLPNKDGSRFFGSPIKIFEYMAMGKAIVASDLEQIGKVLVHEKTAILVKPGDENALMGGILKLAGNKILCDKIGKAAREEVIRNYTWEMNAKRVIQAYEDFI